MVIFIPFMKGKDLVTKIRERARPIVTASWQFLKKEFSDRKNLVRFALASGALVITSQLLPERKIEIAGFGVTTFLALSYIALMIGAPYALTKMKIAINTYTYGAFLWVANTLLLLFYDWILWYFQTESILWVAIYSAILAVFNGIIEDLMTDETH
jgi:uncharacterized membrane protein YvlD (DUF360 family)